MKTLNALLVALCQAPHMNIKSWLPHPMLEDSNASNTWAPHWDFTRKKEGVFHAPYVALHVNLGINHTSIVVRLACHPWSTKCTPPRNYTHPPTSTHWPHFFASKCQGGIFSYSMWNTLLCLWYLVSFTIQPSLYHFMFI